MDPLKINPVKIVNFILFSLSAFGFIYQVYLISSQYMLGKTVVNIDVKRLKSQPLPAITVCIPRLLSIQKLSKLSEYNQVIYQDYMKLINEDIDNKSITNEIQQNLRRIYNNITKDNLGKIVKDIV